MLDRPLPSVEAFAGTSRYSVRRRLGAGAYGVVYEAYDRNHRETVALKVLRAAEADALYRFKRGFRSLTDLRHPNLAELYELHHEEGRWFFSMELIDGQDVVTSLRGDEPSFPDTWDEADLEAQLEDPDSWDHPFPAGSTPDWDRVRGIFLQLGRGLHALHRAGRLHRDIKPPNVLVTREGRVVLLDFGLIGELEKSGELDSGEEGGLVGTPAYMSPEQACGDPIGPSADWYAAGVILFQTITGRLPFEGKPLEILSRKQDPLGVRVADLESSVPGDLADLTERLLAVAPEGRPEAREILARLGDRAGDRQRSGEMRERAESTDSETPFVGRLAAREALEAAFWASRREVTTVFVRGPSGIGKSALIQHFLDATEELPAAPTVLAGRCHLQESVPYKALDSLVDALTRELMRWPSALVQAVLPSPDDLRALTRVFPVLLRVPQVARSRGAGAAQRDPRTVRRRAARALRTLLDGVSRRTPLILVIDDVHWGDLDSFELLDEVLRPTGGPRLLLVASVRSEDEEGSVFLRAFDERRGEGGWSDGSIFRVDLSGLDEIEARELVRAYRLDPDRESLGRLVQDSGGSPLLIAELARWVRSRDSGVLELLAREGLAETDPGGRDAPVRRLLAARLGEVGAEARRLLEAISIAGQPIAVEVARNAAGTLRGATAALAELRNGRWIRERLEEGLRRVEVYHDRVREAVAGELTDAARLALHKRLAVALEAWGLADPETLAIHYRAIGEDARAAEYATDAAGRAERALAFDRAVRLWKLVLALVPEGADERYRSQVRYGEALAHTGRSREAADAWLQAVGAAGATDPIEIQRNAAERLLVSGHIDRGLAVLRHVLRTIGMGLHESPTRTLLELWWHRFRLRWVRFEARSPGPKEIPLLDQLRIDICWSVEIGLCLVDVLHAAQFHALHLRLALASGDPKRIARGLAMELFFGAMDGADVDLAERAGERLAREHGCRYAAALTGMARGMRRSSQGRWGAAAEQLETARRELIATGRAVTWEIDTIQHFRVVALRMLGRWPELFAELPDLLKESRERGDLYLEIHLRQWAESLQLLAEDRPDAAAGAVRRTQGRWSYEGFHYQHFGNLFSRAEVHLYEGRGLLAWEALRESWPALTGSMIQRIELVLVQSLELRGRCALAAAAEIRRADQLPAGLLRTARRCARRLESVGTSWASAHASALMAGVFTLRGREEAADLELARAEVGFLDSAMDVHAAAVARVRRGDERQGATDRLVDIGVVNPGRLTRMLLPGLGLADDGRP